MQTEEKKKCPNCGYEHKKEDLDVVIIKCFYCGKTICVVCREEHYEGVHGVIDLLKRSIEELELDEYWQSQPFIPIDIVEEKLAEQVDYDFESFHVLKAIEELQEEGYLDIVHCVCWKE